MYELVKVWKVTGHILYTKHSRNIGTLLDFAELVIEGEPDSMYYVFKDNIKLGKMEYNEDTDSVEFTTYR